MIPHKKKTMIWFNMDKEEFRIDDAFMCKKESMYKVQLYGTSEWSKEGATITIYEEDLNDDEKTLKFKQSLVDMCIKFKEVLIQNEERLKFNLECVPVRVTRKLVLKTWDEMVKEWGVLKQRNTDIDIIDCQYGFTSEEESFVPKNRTIDVEVNDSVYIWKSSSGHCVIIQDEMVKEMLPVGVHND